MDGSTGLLRYKPEDQDEFDLEKFFREELSLVLCGKTRLNVMLAGLVGVGKSTLINTIFGEPIDPTGVSSSITKSIQPPCDTGAMITTVNPVVTGTELTRQLQHSDTRWMCTTPELFEQKVGDATALAGVREVFVFGTAAGATPFAWLLDERHPAPTTEIGAEARC